MAITKNIETQFGITIENAYLRIESIEINRDLMTINLKKYADKEKSFFAEKNYTCMYNINGENPFKQGYVYLKTLEEFKEAEDC